MPSNNRAFSVDDLRLHRKVMKVSCSAGSDLAICAVRSVKPDDDEYAYDLWAFGPDGRTARQLTDGPGNNQSPHLSPSGNSMAFISDRSGTSQAYLLDLASGDIRQVGDFSNGVENIGWSPDGRFLLVTAPLSVDPDLRGARARTPSSKQQRRHKAKVEVAWRLPYKEDASGYQLAREVHLFTIEVESGSCRQLTDGPFDACAFDVSPDGRFIAYTRSRAGLYAHRCDLWMCHFDGSEHQQLTHELASVMSPTWSPDGRSIAVIGATKEGDAQLQFWLCEPGQGLRPLSSEAVEPASGESFRWQADGASLVFIRAHQGRHCLTSLDVRDGQPRTLDGLDRQLAAFAANERALFYSVDHPSQPSELWACALDGSGERQLSDFNAWWHERMPIRTERRKFQVPDGRGGQETIDGWLLQADDGLKGPKPLLNDVHGGPAAYALLDFDSNVFWQVMCSQGWSVLALNAVGSASYGAEFCGRLAGHWGEYDLPQHLAALDALQAEGICDQRVVISGKSYGGFFSAYAIGECNRFKAAVVMAPVGNIETHYGTSDGGYYADPLYLGTAPRFDRDLARELSPMRRIEQAHTPTLFLQGKEDERCPKCQSEELFVSMFRAGHARTELILYPGESHSFLSEGAPSCRKDAAERIVDWLTEHVVTLDNPVAVEKKECREVESAEPVN